MQYAAGRIELPEWARRGWEGEGKGTVPVLAFENVGAETVRDRVGRADIIIN